MKLGWGRYLDLLALEDLNDGALLEMLMLIISGFCGGLSRNLLTIGATGEAPQC